MSRYKSQVREVINRHAFISLALDRGFNAYLPVYDGGIDFILHREADAAQGVTEATHKVQLKGRWTIDKKYVGKGVSVAFPIGGDWYLMPHDEMVELAMRDGIGDTDSWRNKGTYNRGRPSKAVIVSCVRHRFGSPGQVVAAAVADEAEDEDAGSPIPGTPGPSAADRVLGSMLGGAVGDALGAGIEFMPLAEIRHRFGPAGVTGYVPAYGRTGAITDDTQMTLFTAEGLIRARMRALSKGMCHPPSVVHHAYLRWLLTQGEEPRRCQHVEKNGWLWQTKALHERRAPGNTCLSALIAADGWGSPERARNDSKGCGGVMRVAPVGLFAPVVGDDATVFEMGAATAAFTHGHPSGFLAAGHLAVVIAALCRGCGLDEAIDAADAQLAGRDGSAEVARAVAEARALAGRGRPTPEALETLGGGWVAEEALAIALCCALAAVGFDDAVLMAANHSGDSDSTAAITGNVMGARDGISAIPAAWLDGLEMRTEMERLAHDLAKAMGDEELPFADYPPA